MGSFFLAVALIFEGMGTFFLKNSLGFSVLLPTLLCIGAYILCNLFIAKALNTIPMSVAYATWYGGSVVIAAVLGVLLYQESISLLAGFGLLLILAGIVIANREEA